MFYETWRLIGGDVPRICYSQIKTEPEEGGTQYESKQQLENELSLRFSKLLKTNVQVKVSTSALSDIEFGVFYKGIPLAENCSNFIELQPLRDAIFYIKKYGIDGYEEYIDPEELTCMLELKVGNTNYTVRKYDYLDNSSDRRNFVALNKKCIRRLAQAVGARFMKEGKIR